MAVILQIRDLNVYYGRELVLENINLDVDERDFLGIIGPNGAGKTTLLKAILGIFPYEGEVMILGLKAKNALEKIGYVPQQASVPADFPITVLEFCLLGLLGPNKKFAVRFSDADIKKATELLYRCGYTGSFAKRFSSLSVGQKQRVLIARSLMKDPKLLLLDEPTASIDVKGEDNIFLLLKQINSQGTAIIMVSHDIGVLSVYVNKIACLNRRMVFHGASDKLPTDVIEETYHCPVDVIAHGIPHRVLRSHDD